MEIDFGALAAVARAAERHLAGSLLVWRDRMQAAMNLPDEAIVFIVPPGVLVDVSWLAGSRVIHSPDAGRPMVAIAADGPSVKASRAGG